ncbi:MAG: SPOR domain-containing protein [Marinoscillum sp.]
MRGSKLLIFVVALAAYACKTSSVSTTATTKEAYREDLSVLRPDLTDNSFDTTNIDSTKVIGYGPLTGHIKYELDSVNRIIIEQNKAKRFVDGFTIQVYTGSDRDVANDAVRKVNMINPELEPKIRYVQPSYKVKVGQYISRLEAHEIFESLKTEFPLALLIPERIPVNYD